MENGIDVYKRQQQCLNDIGIDSTPRDTGIASSFYAVISDGKLVKTESSKMCIRDRFIITCIINFKYGVTNNMKIIIWMTFQFVLLYLFCLLYTSRHWRIHLSSRINKTCNKLWMVYTIHSLFYFHILGKCNIMPEFT